jgi:predicted HAD superfamily Cof-like phosphohydrolase
MALNDHQMFSKEEVRSIIDEVIAATRREGFDPVADIEAFHTKFGLAYEGKSRGLTGELADFRLKFMYEELDEYNVAMASLRGLLADPREAKDEAAITELLEHMLDALVDLVYVAIGTSYLHGFDFREAWRRVQHANMQKVRAQRAEDSKRGTTFDVVKPSGWTPPSHTDLVEDHAHRKYSSTGNSPFFDERCNITQEQIDACRPCNPPSSPSRDSSPDLQVSNPDDSGQYH